MVPPDGRRDSARRAYLAPILAIAFAGLAVLVAVIAAVPGDWLGGGSGSPTVGATASPTALPTGTSSPSPSPPVAIVRIEVVQPSSSDRPDSGSGTQTFVSLLTAVGALLAGVGALAALRRPPAGPAGRTPEEPRQPPAEAPEGGAPTVPPGDAE